MKNKFLIAFLAIVSALCCAFGFAACDGGTKPDNSGNKPDSSTCEHEFGMDAFENGELGHWFYCKKCGDKINKPHEYDDSLICVYCKYHVHDYSAKTVSNTYLKENANCEHGDLYYLSCKLCGASSWDKTFENGMAKHDLTHVQEIPSTCYEKGNKEYWTCNTCKRYFADEEGKDVISDKTTVEYEIKTHNYSNGICNLCGKAQDKDITYTFALNDDKQSYTLRAVRGTDVKGEMTLPAEFNAMPVTRIEGIASYGQIYVFDDAEITDIIIPEGVTYIGIAAFVNCNSLKSVTIPESVTSIDRQAFYKSGNALDITVSNATIYGEAFYECNLNNVTVGNGATSIGSEAFYKCSIKNAVIGTGITNFGIGVFRECSGMESVTVPFIKRQSDNYNYSFGYNWFNNKVPSTLKTVTVTGTGDTAIESNSINCEYIENINLGDGIAAVCDRSFYGCTALKNITIGSGLETIEYGAFSYCEGVENLTVDGNNPNFIYDGGIIYNKDKTNVVAALQKIKDEVILPAEVKSIGARAFSGCSLITSVTIGNNVTSIGDNAFEGCAALTSITIGNSVTSIGDNAFKGCAALESVNYTGSIADWCQIGGLHYLMFLGKSDKTLYINGNKLTGELIIPDGVTSIESYAFYNCDGLTNVTIPDSVTSIGISAFKGCTSVESIVLPFVGNELNGTENTHLGYIFGASIYSDNKKSLPETLNSVTINGGSSVDGNAFYECASLTSVTLGNGVVSIGDRAFYDCDSLENITIGNSINSICRAAFYYCDLLQNIYYNGNIKSWCEIDGLSNLMAYGANNKTLYLNGEEVTEITIPDGVTAIGENTFRNLSSLTSVTIGSNVVSIGDYAFYCTSLTDVTIPDSVNSIGQWAFGGCSDLENINYTGDIANWCKISGLTNLMSYGSWDKKLYLSGEETTEIIIPDSVTSIGENTFRGFSSVTDITIGKGVTSIEEGAFYNCKSITNINYTGDIASWCKISGLDNLMFQGSSNNKLYLSGEEVTELVIPDGVTSIGYAAFGCCTSITSVTIPDSVTEISDYAFVGCKIKNAVIPAFACSYILNSKLETVEITSGDTIENKTFYNCTSIESITICRSVTSIGDEAFYGCGRLTDITIPNSVTSIGTAAFSGCSSITSITIPDNMTAIGNEVFYGCSNLEGITIPESVTSIGDKAFYYCSKLTGVLIPNSVTEIGDRAFYSCASLTSITIPEGVTSISDSAFYDCTSLTTVTISYGVKEIGSWTFGGCSKLTSITIPNSVTSIDNGAFRDCTSLISITIPDSVTAIGDSVFSGCSKLTGITIPDSVTTIGDSVFSGCSKLTGITIPDGVTSIGSSVFNGCTSLESITLPFVGDSIKTSSDTYQYPFGYIFGTQRYTGSTEVNQHYYGETTENYTSATYYIPTTLREVVIMGGNILFGAFSGCAILTDVTLPDGITSIGNQAFYDCSSLTSVNIPDTVTSIGDMAFYNCSSLTSISIPDGVTSIGDGAFNQCSVLADVSIPDSVTYIGSSAFARCFALVSVTIPNGVAALNNSVFYECSYLTSVSIPDGVTIIDMFAFAYCGNLTSIILPDSLTSIGGGAFHYCGGITNINIPDGVTSIGGGAFENCTSLEYNEYDNALYLGNDNNAYLVLIKARDTDITSCEINERTKIIYARAFSDCSGLTDITIPDSVIEIGDNAFLGCQIENAIIPAIACKYVNNSKLTTVEITSGNSIDAWAFAYYASLTTVIIPESVTEIGAHAFDGCSGLISITLPGGVTSIGEFAFNGCRGLTSIIIGNNVTSIGSWAFSGCSSLTGITIPDSVTSIGRGAFDGCTALEYNEYDNALYLGNSSNQYLALIKAKSTDITSCNINANTKMIYHSAFENCSGLTDITIPDSVTSIGQNAFAGCSSLTGIIIPDSITEISYGMFSWCTSLTSVIIPDSVTSIGEWVFSNCTSLTSITIPDSVTSIGNYLFDYSTALTSINFEGTKEQWRALKANSYWNESIIGNYTVTCSDGTISKYE
ncbi:MAG: leucine-rich repeat domain-containing protein [Clostridia bacterium]|nr:leucine-rich repeat domain-containing protein [Clostridia bacterium]